MNTTATLRVKGTYYYEGGRLMQSGSLYRGCPIRLEHHPDNPHDSNAVAVKLADSGAMLGHLPRLVAPDYAAAIKAGVKFNTTVLKAAYSSDYLDIDIRINWEQTAQIAISPVIQHKDSTTFKKNVVPTGRRAVETERNDSDEQPLSIVVESISELAGVYAIENTKANSYYIGSSQNIRSRLKMHLSDLKAGRHANNRLQGDYSARTAKDFRAYVIKDGLAVEELAEEEKRAIEEYRLHGLRLYNLTDDGQGVPPRGDTSIYTEARPIVPRNIEPVQPRQEPPRDTPRVDIPASGANGNASRSIWGWWAVVAVFGGWFLLNSGKESHIPAPSPSPKNAMPASPNSPPPITVPAPAPASGTNKRTRTNEDARECLKLSTNAEIIKCAEKFR